MEKERVLILDFGGQYNQLIARRVRECRVYCEVHPHDMALSDIRAFAPSGIIFTSSASATAASFWPRGWAAPSSLRKATAHASTAKPIRNLTPEAPCLRGFRRRASRG